MRALITGGKGFVGHWLAAHLKDAGDEVVVTDIETDISDGPALRKVVAAAAPDAIYHLAAMTHVGQSWESPSAVLSVNVLGTACVLAAARADLVSAVGAVAGLRSGDGHTPTRPVPVLAFHGTADRINPYLGGNTPRWNESVEESARHWAAANRMPEQPEVVALSPTLTRTTYGDEGKPGEVTLFTSKGAGHTWPGGHLGLFLRLFLGRTSKEIDATAKIWDFDRAHAGEA